MKNYNEILVERIHVEILNRSWSIVLPQIPCILIFLLFAPEMLQQSLLFQLGVASILLATALFATNKLRNGLPSSLFDHSVHTGAALLGSGWAFILISFFLAKGMMAPVSLLAGMIVCGQNSGAFILLGYKRSYFYSYMLPMFLFPILVSAVFTVKDLQDFTMLVLMSVYNIFLNISAPAVRDGFCSVVLNGYRLTQEQEKVQALLDAFPGIVSILDDQQKYQMINKFGAEMVGDTNVIGKPLGFRTSTDQFVKTVREFHADLERKHFTQEVFIETASAAHWYLISLHRLHHPQGWIMIVSIIIDDIIKARTVLAEEKMKADYAARLASLGEMAQGVAHEINNPLAVVMFSADEIHQRAQRGELDVKFLENFSGKIVMMSKRIANIVKGMRYFSRDAEKDPIQPVLLSVIIDQTVEFKAEKCKNYGITLEIAAYDPSVQVLCREVQIMQALLNLLNNAFDAVKESENGWIRLAITDDPTHVSIFISNSGPLISEETSQRMFDPFFTTKEVGKGSGMGLSIALGLLQNNGGDLRFISEPATCFEMRLAKPH